MQETAPHAPAVLWLRRDLRTGDHPALLAACAAAGDAGVLALFVLDPALWSGAGPVRRAWLAASLRALDESLDGRLVVRVGDPAQVVPAVVREVGAGSVHLTRETTGYGVRRDRRVRAALDEAGAQADAPPPAWTGTGTPYVVDPGTIRTKEGTPYKVFTPFSRAWREHGWPAPAPRPGRLDLLTLDRDGEADRLLVDALAEPDLPALPRAGEEAALHRWREFVEGGLAFYRGDRDRPAVDGTSRLSPYLKIGALHPRTLLADLARQRGEGAQTYVTELAWREFYADVLHAQPATAWRDLRPALAGMRYEEQEDAIEAWKQGRTGYPVVDAGMRQLLGMGWMHNRVRMITASFLTKDLHVWWPVGARWFLERLVDGDLASNNHGWQWVAGTGTDAAPYFRVFNPVSQGEKFDPDGDYVRRWVPELRHLPGAAVHRPWDHEEGYVHDYPRRIVDHAEERREALARYEEVKG